MKIKNLVQYVTEDKPPTSLTCVRKLWFSAGHRVHGHESVCANLHGHNYICYFHAEGDLDSIGRVIDFSVLKQRIGSWLDQNWDHSFLFHTEDREVKTLFTTEAFITHKHFECPFNPTAENMAWYLLNEVCPNVLRGTNVRVYKVVLYETENCYAEAESA